MANADEQTIEKTVALYTRGLLMGEELRIKLATIIRENPTLLEFTIKLLLSHEDESVQSQAECLKYYF